MLRTLNNFTGQDTCEMRCQQVCVSLELNQQKLCEVCITLDLWVLFTNLKSKTLLTVSLYQSVKSCSRKNLLNYQMNYQNIDGQLKPRFVK